MSQGFRKAYFDQCHAAVHAKIIIVWNKTLQAPGTAGESHVQCSMGIFFPIEYSMDEWSFRSNPGHVRTYIGHISREHTCTCTLHNRNRTASTSIQSQLLCNGSCNSS